jgi:hypothetical protein
MTTWHLASYYRASHLCLAENSRLKQSSYVLNGSTNTRCSWLDSVVPNSPARLSSKPVPVRCLLASVIANHWLKMHQCVHDTHVYVSTMVHDAAATFDRFAACLVNVEAWLKAIRVRLKSTKTQYIWLGSNQLLVKLDIDEVRALTSKVRLQNTARDRRPSDNGSSSRCCVPAATTSCSNCEQFSTTCKETHQDVSPWIYLMLLGLLQLTIFWHLRRNEETSAVSPHCCRSTK